MRQGVTDLAAGRCTTASLLVSIGATRLRCAGVSMPPPIADADHLLYLRLVQSHGDDAHSCYNALLRTLVSYERAVECAS